MEFKTRQVFRWTMWQIASSRGCGICCCIWLTQHDGWGVLQVDILLPKHYFFHRGFDGMVGTVGRSARSPSCRGLLPPTASHSLPTTLCHHSQACWSPLCSQVGRDPD